MRKLKKKKMQDCRTCGSFLWYALRLNKKNLEKIAIKNENLKLNKARFSEHSKSLIVRQRILRVYGRQAGNIFKVKKSTSRSFTRKLENRLDIALFRTSFFASLGLTRQLISHGYITVNFKKVNLFNFSLISGDIIMFKLDHCNNYSKILTNFFKIIKKRLELVLQKKCIFITNKRNPKASVFKLAKSNHLEINYKAFVGILLFPLQDIYFPCELNMNQIL